MSRIPLAISFFCLMMAHHAFAQSFCDLLPPAAVVTSLGLTGTLTAKPDTSGGNGCDYSNGTPNVDTVTTDSSDSAGMMQMMFQNGLANLGPDDQKTSIAGQPAIYTIDNQVTFLNNPNANYTKQSLQFIDKGKYVSISVTTPGETGLPQAAIMAFGTLADSKPINTLIDPPS